MKEEKKCRQISFFFFFFFFSRQLAFIYNLSTLNNPHKKQALLDTHLHTAWARFYASPRRRRTEMIPKSATTLRRGDSVVVFSSSSSSSSSSFSLFGKRRRFNLHHPCPRRRHQNHQTHHHHHHHPPKKYSSRGVLSFAAVKDDANARDEDFLHKLGVKLRKETGREAKMPPGRVGLFGVRETLEYLMDSNAFVETRVKKYGPIFKTAFFFKPTIAFERSRG
jgi:hypothetical protein